MVKTRTLTVGKTAKSSCANQGGFTLIELLVVIVIMGLAYALAAPLVFSGLTGAELKATARQLAAGLRKARSDAVYHRREEVLTLDLENRQFQLSGQTKLHKLPKSVAIEIFTAQSERVSQTSASIRFFADGGSTGGRITVSSRERSYGVDVNWLTGQVAIID